MEWGSSWGCPVEQQSRGCAQAQNPAQPPAEWESCAGGYNCSGQMDGSRGWCVVWEYELSFMIGLRTWVRVPGQQPLTQVLLLFLSSTGHQADLCHLHQPCHLAGPEPKWKRQSREPGWCLGLGASHLPGPTCVLLVRELSTGLVLRTAELQAVTAGQAGEGGVRPLWIPQEPDSWTPAPSSPKAPELSSGAQAGFYSLPFRSCLSPDCCQSVSIPVLLFSLLSGSSFLFPTGFYLAPLWGLTLVHFSFPPCALFILMSTEPGLTSL